MKARSRARELALQYLYQVDLTKDHNAKILGDFMRHFVENEEDQDAEAYARELIEGALLRGEPVFFKSTVDMLPWRPATWYTPIGEAYPVVLSNDHALVVMGFNADEVIVRLGYRETINGAVSYTASGIEAGDDGVVPVHREGRYLRVNIRTIAGSAAWTQGRGAQVHWGGAGKL